MQLHLMLSLSKPYLTLHQTPYHARAASAVHITNYKVVSVPVCLAYPPMPYVLQ